MKIVYVFQINQVWVSYNLGSPDSASNSEWKFCEIFWKNNGLNY